MTTPRVDEVGSNAVRYARLITEGHELYVLDEINALPKKTALYLMCLVYHELTTIQRHKFLERVRFAALESPRSRMVYSKKNGKRVTKKGKIPTCV